jgi:hypothetical protein
MSIIDRRNDDARISDRRGISAVSAYYSGNTCAYSLGILQRRYEVGADLLIKVSTSH